MATTNGTTPAPAFQFVASTLKTTSEFYKCYVAGKLTEENFKWPECPYKMVGENNAIGSLQNLDTIDVDGSESSHSQSPNPYIQQIADQVKSETGERNGVPKTESMPSMVIAAPTSATGASMFPMFMYPLIPNAPNPQMPFGNMAMSWPNMPMAWGNATPHPSATPMHSMHRDALSIDHDTETKVQPALIPLESNFDVELRDPRAEPQYSCRKVIELFRTAMTNNFVESHNRTNNIGGGSRRVARANPIVNNDALMQKKVRTQQAVRGKENVVNGNGENHLENGSASNSDYDLSPAYEPTASKDEIEDMQNGYLPKSSDDDDDDSESSNELNSSTRPETRSTTSKKRKRSHSSGKRSKSKHRRSHRSTREERVEKREKRRSSGKHSHKSEKRDQSRQSDKQPSKRQKVSPLRIDKRSNTVIKGELDLDELSDTPTVTHLNPPYFDLASDTLDSDMDLFSGPIRKSSTVAANNFDDHFPDDPFGPSTSVHCQTVKVIASIVTETEAADVEMPSTTVNLTDDTNAVTNEAMATTTNGDSCATDVNASMAIEMNGDIGVIDADASKTFENETQPFINVVNESNVGNNVTTTVELGHGDETNEEMIENIITPTVDSNNGVGTTEVMMENDVTATVELDGADEMIEEMMCDLKVSQSTIEELDEVATIVNALNSHPDEPELHQLPPNTSYEMNQVSAASNSKCALCSHKTDKVRYLVAHYVSAHADKEVYISRMTLKCSESVKNDTFAAINPSVASVCPFCNESLSMTAAEWITHFTEHTGEYEFKCSKCDAVRLSGMALCNCDNANAVRDLDFVLDHGALRAYMCISCHYMQLSQMNIEKHISNEHQLTSYYQNCDEFILLRKLEPAVHSTAENGTQQEAESKAITPTEIIEFSDESQEPKEAAIVEQEATASASVNVEPVASSSVAAFEEAVKDKDLAAPAPEPESTETKENVESNKLNVSASDSKNTTELVVAKEQIRIAVAERLATVAKVEEDVIELSDESDVEGEEDPNRPIIIPMSCYAVDDSDDDTEEEGKEKEEKEEEKEAEK